MTTPTLPRDRCEFSAIVDRPPLKLPGEARLVFWTIVNYEVWDIGRPMPRQVLPAPTGVSLLPDVPHWSWHEYGMRVGAWRFFELYERLGIRPTLSINARTCEDYARVAEEAKRLRWEFMGHGYDQIPIHKVDDQAAMINRSMDILERFSGRPHRIKYLEAIYDHARRFEGVLHWNGAEILDWYLAAAKTAKTGFAA